MPEDDGGKPSPPDIGGVQQRVFQLQLPSEAGRRAAAAESLGSDTAARCRGRSIHLLSWFQAAVAARIDLKSIGEALPLRLSHPRLLKRLRLAGFRLFCTCFLRKTSSGLCRRKNRPPPCACNSLYQLPFRFTEPGGGKNCTEVSYGVTHTVLTHAHM